MIPLEPGETIIRVVHRSIFGLLPGLLLALVTALAGAFFISQGLQIGLVLVGFAVIIFIIAFRVWRLNRLILTNKHLIDYSSFTPFLPNIQRLALDRDFAVQSYKTNIIADLFGYGRLDVQTGDGMTKLTFYYMPEVEQLADDIEAARQAMHVTTAPI